MNNNINWIGNQVFDSQNSAFTEAYDSLQGYGGESYAPQEDFAIQAPVDEQGPPPVMDRLYIPGYLASNIGRNILAEFVVGNNIFTDKSGRLIEVGVNYFVLEDLVTGAHVMCDLYSVRFVTVR